MTPDEIAALASALTDDEDSREAVTDRIQEVHDYLSARIPSVKSRLDRPATVEGIADEWRPVHAPGKITLNNTNPSRRSAADALEAILSPEESPAPWSPDNEPGSGPGESSDSP